MERDLVGFHLGFAVLAAVALLVPEPGATGPWLLAAVLAYHAGSLGVSRGRGHEEWTATWGFAALLSVWMVLPDAVLVRGLGVLAFPPDGVPDVLGVTLPMAGMWAVPIVLIVATADAVTRRRGERAGLVAAVLAAGAVFGGAEATLTLVPVWEPVGVTTIGGFAPYILPAELLLGLLAVLGARASRHGSLALRVAVTGLVALAYTGAAAVSWLLIEGALLA